ncbi:hsp7-like protein [Fonsecaea monophora]|uniref:Hsp7-like protein n=1 Tax=Fonsecaea monophora TaxID=254056 RepID=A0A177EZP6_9EURO|nr:hsp7-like protein [Fonsecaea monophora]KAH0829898.1 hypothetical protein FOPE_10519 [Fonsecaea pedrosoi]OAG36522.1 hsp7-like protein [Fonsecaea monophora]
MVANRPVTPREEEEASGNAQNPTAVKEKVRTLTQFCQQKGLDVSQQDIFRFCNVPPRTGYRYIAASQEPRRHHNSPYQTENRGRRPLLSNGDFEAIEDWILQGGFYHRVCAGLEVLQEVFPDRDQISKRTIQRAFQSRGYYKCIACQKPFLTAKSIKERREYLAIRRHWPRSRWRHIRFSDECHFGRGPQRKLRIIRRPGERYHRDCIQKTPNEKTAKHKNEKRWHIWAAVGYNFKSRLIFYETSSSNGKMTSVVYIDQVLNEVKRWIENGEDFILEEDQDSAHGVGEDSSVRRYKEQIGLNYFFNASGSPDLSPIENIWRVQKQKIKQIDHFDDDSLVQAINQAWEDIPQETINRYIDSMVDRMASLALRGGDVTGY